MSTCQLVVHVEVIEAAESHVCEIVEMWKDFMDFHRDIDPFYTRKKDAHKNFKTYIQGLIQSDDAQVLVTLHNGRVVAYSISTIQKNPPIYLDDTYGFISDLAVDPAYQRRGIGETMLHKMFEWFASRNIKRVELRVAAKNQIGYTFWKKHGFQDYEHVLYVSKRDGSDSTEF